MMDRYYECSMNNFLVPEDQDLLDRHPSPDTWSKWGINAPEELYKHEPVIAWDSVLEDLSYVEDQHKSFYFCPENSCNNITGGLQNDIEASKFVPCNSNSKDCLDIECSRDEAMYEQSSVEESILQNLEIVIEQFTEKTRISFRDALYRLARNTKQQHEVENLDGDLCKQKAMLQAVPNETMMSEDKKPMESETNGVDRAVANLMFNKMEINMQDLPVQDQ